MKQSVYRAFGYVFYINDLSAGDILNVDVNTSTRCVTYCISGDFEVYDAETNERLPNYSKGFFYYTYNEPIRKYRYICIEDSRGFCYDPRVNNNIIPKIEKVFIPANSSQEFAKGTKFFLMGGKANIQQTEFTGPARIQISTATATVSAVTDCYGVTIG